MYSQAVRSSFYLCFNICHEKQQPLFVLTESNDSKKLLKLEKATLEICFRNFTATVSLTSNCISFLLSFISVPFANSTVGGLEHRSEVLYKSSPGCTVLREHVMSTVLSAGWSSTRTALKVPLGARMKPAGGRIRNGVKSRANVTGGPVDKQ